MFTLAVPHNCNTNSKSSIQEQKKSCVPSPSSPKDAVNTVMIGVVVGAGGDHSLPHGHRCAQVCMVQDTWQDRVVASGKLIYNMITIKLASMNKYLL